MRELLILILIGGVAYLAYDDYYKQRPALSQAQAEVQQVRQNLAQLAASPVPRVWIPVTPTPPAWFRKHLDAGPAVEMSHQHTRQGELQTTPHP
jgi:hypothetical protein